MTTSSIDIGFDALNVGLVQAVSSRNRCAAPLTNEGLADLVATRVDEYPEIDVEILLAGIQFSLSKCSSVEQFREQFVSRLSIVLGSQHASC